MFEKLIEKIKSLAVARIVFDPSRFGDPVATRTAWTPAKGGGANFQTHKLVKVDFSRVEFRATIGAKIFYGVFLGAGLAVMIIFPFVEFSRGLLRMEALMPVGIGLVFAGAGGCLFYFGAAPSIFDKRKGYFWKGWKEPELIGDKTAVKVCVRLDDIHALQVISEYCSGNKSSYYSYELNIVLQDASRVNVADHGNLQKLRQDARELALFLGKPLWDAL